MSNITNRAKDAITRHDDTTPTTTTTTGARSVGAGETHVAIDPDTTTTGPHRSDMANRADRMFVPIYFRLVGPQY